MNNLQKLTVLVLFASTNKHTDNSFKEAINDFLQHPEMGKAIHDLTETDHYENGVLSKKGRAIAHKLNSIGVNYEESATRGSFGNALAMVNGGWEGLKHHVKDGNLYINSSAFESIEKIVREGTELLKNASDETLV